MIIIGVLLILLGYLLGIGLLYTVGAILLVVGLVLLVVGHAGPVGGRWW
jgi:hypothetical protein